MDAPGVRSFTNETDDAKLSTIRSLVDSGVPLSLSAQDLRDEDGLARQAMYAMRAGLDRQEALQLVTSAAASMIGMEDEIGTVEVGKRGDLVVWTGAPFDATSEPAIVLINGEVVVDRR